MTKTKTVSGKVSESVSENGLCSLAHRLSSLTYWLTGLLAYGLLCSAAAAPVSLTYIRDLCWYDEDLNCIPVDVVRVTALQPAGKAAIFQYSEDLVNWYFMHYWPPGPEAQETYIGWLFPANERREKLFFRVLDSEPVDFFAPLQPPSGAFGVETGARKRPPQTFRVPSSEFRVKEDGSRSSQPGTRNPEPGTDLRPLP